MIRAFVFPGQGAHAVGMGLALHDAMAEARLVFEEVDEALGEPLSRLIFYGPEETLRLTENAQPALMATSLAAVRALEAASGRPLVELCQMVAGHSLGEYSALAAAGSLPIGETARLLRRRGRAMQAAVPVGEGAMAAILGLDLAAVEAAAAAAAGICDVANDNAPGQVVVSGERAAVEQTVALAKAAGARRTMLLPVSAPFHCRLMAPAAEAMRVALAETPLTPPAVPLITNVTAAPERDPAQLVRHLVEQVTARVRWRESLLQMAEMGVGATVEMGAGRVLSGLVKRTLPGVPTAGMGTPADIEACLAAGEAGN